MRRVQYSLLLLTLCFSFLLIGNNKDSLNSQVSAKEKKKSSLYNHPLHKQWDRDMKIFGMKDEVNPTTPGCTIFVGSSSILFWHLEKSFPGKGYLNRGFGGSEIADSIYFAEILILKHKPKQIVFYAGDNDISRKKTIQQVIADFQKFETLIHDKLPETQIYYVCIKPSLSRWNLSGEMKKANDQIQAICDQKKHLEYIDIWNPMLGEDGRPQKDLFIKDGLHLNAKGYQLWTSLLKPHLK